MKVLHVIYGLGTGGAERSLAELVPALAARGVEGTIACLVRRAAGVEAPLLAAGVDVRFVDRRGVPAQARALRRLAREIDADVIHTTIFESDLAGRLAAIGTGIPVVTSLVNPSYGPERHQDPNVRRWRLEVIRVVDGWTARHLTAGFVAISRAVADAAVRDLRLRRDRIAVVPRGRDRARLHATSGDRGVRGELGIDAGVPVVVHVGRQDFQKGIDVLLAAIALVRQDRPDVVLVQAGRRNKASAVLDRTVAELDLAETVRFLGHRDDIAAVLAAADVVAFPSRFEGLGGSLVEAAGAGVPVVASDLPAIREVVEDGGSGDLVPADDPARLAAALVALLDDPERRAAYGQRGRVIFEERFTLEAVADRFAAALRGFADRARGGARRRSRH